MILDPKHFRLDDVLRRPYTPTTPFGASGDCLWATSPQGWGFRDGVHWVHKTGDSGLTPFSLTLYADGIEVTPGDAVYRPSHVTLHGKDIATGLQVTEDKFLTRDDVVVSVLSLRNPSEFTVEVGIDFSWGITEGIHEFRPGIPVYVHRQGPPGDDLRQRVPAFGRAELTFVVAFAPTREEAFRRANRWRNDTNPAWTQADEYQTWFTENMPLFECSDPWLTKMWYHRWYVLRKNHMRPGLGLTQEDSFSEGRWNSEWYSASITYGAGHVLRDLRWLRNPEYARNYFRGFARNQRKDGLYRSWYVDGIARPDTDEGKYTDWITASVRDVHLVHPDTEFLEEALPALEKNVAYWQTHSWDGDALLIVDSHWWTGMEWQPSFFCRANYELGERRDGRDVQNPVKRLDLTSYQYANVRALAAIQATLGLTDEAKRFEELAQTIRQATLAKMWDADHGFFYDLLPETDKKIVTAKTIAAFYPFYAGLPGVEQTTAWDKLVDPALFWTPYPPASTAQDSPAYAQEQQMKGKPVTGCYWNGPTWPHANSLVISGLARWLREQSASLDAERKTGLTQTLYDLTTSFCRAQYESGDYECPRTGEFYRGDNGVWQTPERDYLHSTWADLIIGGLIGLVPRDDDALEMHPLLPDKGEEGAAPIWDYFCLQGVPYHGRLLTIVWDSPAHPEDAFHDGDKGLTVYADGVRLHHQETLAPFIVAFPS